MRLSGQFQVCLFIYLFYEKVLSVQEHQNPSTLLELFENAKNRCLCLFVFAFVGWFWWIWVFVCSKFFRKKKNKMT